MTGEHPCDRCREAPAVTVRESAVEWGWVALCETCVSRYRETIKHPDCRCWGCTPPKPIFDR